MDATVFSLPYTCMEVSRATVVFVSRQAQFQLGLAKGLASSRVQPAAVGRAPAFADDCCTQHGMLAVLLRHHFLTLLLFCTLVNGARVAGQARTYITNDSSQTIVAVVSFAYFPEPVPVPVKNRVLRPGAHGQCL